MVGTDIGDHRRVGARYRDSAAQDAAACGFQNGGLRARIAHHHARAGGSGIIARCQRVHRREIPRPCSCIPPASRGPARRPRSRRTVVVLPLEPVTSAVGMSAVPPMGPRRGVRQVLSAKLRSPRRPPGQFRLRRRHAAVPCRGCSAAPAAWANFRRRAARSAQAPRLPQ